MSRLASYWTLISFLLSVSSTYGQTQSVESNNTIPSKFYDEEMNINRLRSKLLWKQKYQRYARPVKRHSTITNVTISFYLLNINSLSPLNHLLDVNGYLMVEWVDEHLRWDPLEFGGIDRMNFNYWEVWTPEVVHWNSARGGWSFYSINRSIRIRVNATGHVVWDPDAGFTSPCDMDLDLYPFDTQYCTLIFGSWTYSSNQVIFTPDSLVNHDWLSTNPEWEVSTILMGRNDLDMAPSKDHYSAISATIHMKRHTTLYFYYIFLPYFLSTAFILSSFLTPISSPLRIIFPSFALFILTFLLIFLSTILVGTHSLNVPYAVKCVGVHVGLVGFLVFLMHANLNLVHKCRKPITLPVFIQTVVGNPLVTKVLCLPTKSILSPAGNLINEDDDEEVPSQRINVTGWKRKEQVTDLVVVSQLVDRLLMFSYILFLLFFHS